MRVNGPDSRLAPTVAGIGVGLDDAVDLLQMPLLVILRVIAGAGEEGCRW